MADQTPISWGEATKAWWSFTWRLYGSAFVLMIPLGLLMALWVRATGAPVTHTIKEYPLLIRVIRVASLALAVWLAIWAMRRSIEQNLLPSGRLPWRETLIACWGFFWRSSLARIAGVLGLMGVILLAQTAFRIDPATWRPLAFLVVPIWWGFLAPLWAMRAVLQVQWLRLRQSG